MTIIMPCALIVISSGIAQRLRNWHFDIPTLLLTLLALPLITYFIGILRKHGKAWGGYLVEGACYWFGRFLMHSLSARFSLRRYCRLQLQKENQYLHVPSRNDVKLRIDQVFVNLRLEQQAGRGAVYNHLTLFSVGNRIRVIGDPGSGKSSLVKRILRDACLEGISKPSKAKLPLLIELKDVAIPKNIAQQKLGDWFYNFLRQGATKSDVYRMDECFDNYSRGHGLIVLLDGLDEVASSEYEKVQSAIIGLSDKLANLSPKNSIILTMRTQLHEQIRQVFRDYFGPALFVKPFSPTDIYEFLSKWPFVDSVIGPAIFAELTDRPTLREMCTNPLVLAMYVAERQFGTDPLTPESRTDFYRRVLEELLIKRRVRQTGSPPALSKLREQREQILGRLAYDHMLDHSEPANSLSWKNAIRIVMVVMDCSEQRAEELFLQICKETGLVSQEKEQETLRFIHLTFCEFLAAHEAVQGQRDGLDRLIQTQKLLNTSKTPQRSSRLLEVIPFACGLIQRSLRGDAISAISDLGDERLLARCFLETKAYEHPSWKLFAEATRDRLLGTPENEWNEEWLQDLHLFNVVARDAAQCSAHLANVTVQIDLGEFYEKLVKQQGGGSLSTLMSAYAVHDAPAAIRLAEVSGLDLPSDFPEVIIANCDQAPFLSLVVNKMLADLGRVSVWAAPLAEAALSSSLVANTLWKMPPNDDVLAPQLEKQSNRTRWDVRGITNRSIYTQILSMATPSGGAVSDCFQRLKVLVQAPVPGSLGFRKLLYNSYFLSAIVLALFPITVVAMLAVLLSGKHLSLTAPLRDPIGLSVGGSIALIFYWTQFRGLSPRLFYLKLLNLGPRSKEGPRAADLRAAFQSKKSPVHISPLSMSAALAPSLWPLAATFVPGLLSSRERSVLTLMSNLEGTHTPEDRARERVAIS
jgi:hypothetical protein